MAFTLERTWREETRWRAGAGAEPLLAAFLPQRWQRPARTGGALLLTAAIHFGLIWILLTRLVPDGSAAERAAPARGASGPLLFELGAPVAAQLAVRETVPAAMAEAPRINLSAATDLPPPEWSLASLPPLPQRTLPDRPAAPAATAGSGSGGSGVYDPFAGAAPLRRGPLAAAQANNAGDATDGLDLKLLETLRAAVARAYPGRRGSVLLFVRVTPDGSVIEAQIRGGSAPADAKEAMRRAVEGRRLYLEATATLRQLDLRIGDVAG